MSTLARTEEAPAATDPGVRRGRPAASLAKTRLTNRWATLAALLIAALWTVPTIGLLVSSFRPAQQVRTTGW